MGAPCRASEEGCLAACALLTSGQYSVCPRRLEAGWLWLQLVPHEPLHAQT